MAFVGSVFAFAVAIANLAAPDFIGPRRISFALLAVAALGIVGAGALVRLDRLLRSGSERSVDDA